MARTARTRTRSLADRLQTAAGSCADMETLTRAVFDTVADDVPFAFACLATTDPANGLINAAYKSHPLPVGDQEFAASEYGGPDLNQFAELAQRQPPVGLLSVDTGGEPMRCRRFSEYMAPQFGFTDELRLVCRGPQLTWGLLGLYRGEGQPPFTPADGRLLASVHEAISDAVRRVLFADHPVPTSGAGTPVVLILDGEDGVTDMSTAAETVIDELGGWDHGTLPASAVTVASSSRRQGAPAEAQVPTPSGRWFKVRAMPLGEGPTGTTVVLTIERADPAVVGQMAIAARGLTVREQEVVALVLQGASTKDIAGRLYLSPHTVQDHLKAVFAKLGVSSRRELIGQFVLT